MVVGVGWGGAGWANAQEEGETAEVIGFSIHHACTRINRESTNTVGLKQEESAAKKKIGEGDVQEEEVEEEEEEEVEEEEEEEEEEKEEEERQDYALCLLNILVRLSTSSFLPPPSIPFPFLEENLHHFSPPYPHPPSLPPFLPSSLPPFLPPSLPSSLSPSFPSSDQTRRAAGLVVRFSGAGMDRPLSLGDHHNL